MRRRTLPVLSVGWLLGLLSVANTQPVQEAKHVGLLSTGDNPLTLALRDGLRERGWIESSNIILHTRWTEGKQDRAQAMAAEGAALSLALGPGSPSPGSSPGCVAGVREKAVGRSSAIPSTAFPRACSESGMRPGTQPGGASPRRFVSGKARP